MADPVADSLLEYRKAFPALEECVHFISHSLGCVPGQTKEDLAEFFDLWRTKSITAWSDWLPEVDRAAERIQKIISAPHGTVTMMHNVSQIMAVLASCFEYTPERNRVVESGRFGCRDLGALRVATSRPQAMVATCGQPDR